MATQIQNQPPVQSSSGLVPYRLTVHQPLKMADAGILGDEDHVELLGGLLVEKMVKNPPHKVAVNKLAAALRGLILAGWFVNEEKSVQLSRWSHPEPDGAVIRGVPDDYSGRDPTPAEIGMVAEVADSSYPMDRGVKWRKYAAARIPIYWIVNLPRRQIEVHMAPSGRGKSAGYRDTQVYGPDDEVPVSRDGRELGRMKVSDVLPLIVKS
jgi:Uma2 family endonuclease